MPARWIQHCSLKAGDEISVEEQGKSLIINCEHSIIGGELSLDVSGLGPMVRRVVASAYKAGYDRLSIHFESPEELDSITQVIGKTCMGFEILKQEKDYVVAKKILNVLYEEFDPVLRRVFLSLNSMANDSLEGYQKMDISLMKTVILRDDNINKFTDFCRRSLNRRGYADFKKTPLVYHIVEELEKISDMYKYICEDTIKEGRSDKNILPLFRQVNEFFGLFYSLFYKYDLKKMKTFGNKFRAIKKEKEAILDDCKDANIVFRLYFIAALVYDLNGALIALNLH